MPDPDEAGNPAATPPPSPPTSASWRGRYLSLLKDALLDRHYLENEVRLEYLLGQKGGAAPDPAVLRDPARTLEVRYQNLVQARRAGRSVDDPKGGAYTPFTDMGEAALDHLEATVADLERRDVPGDVVLCGVERGGGGVLVKACLDAGTVERTVWMVDPYLATDGVGVEGDAPGRARLRADLNQVRDAFHRFDLFDDRVRFVQGGYRDSLADAPIGNIALLRLGVDAAFDVGNVLARLLPRVVPGGVVIVEGLGRPIVADRLEAFRAERGITEPLARIDWDTVAWEVAGPVAVELPEGALEPEPGRAPHRVPLAPPRPADQEALELSVVVVFYNMARESARTLLSLSRAYQRGIDDLRYEVIVVDNGSSPEHRLTDDQVGAYGPEFRLIRIDDAHASPTQALNRGIAESRGDTVAVMIDGAHVLTPGVFRHARSALSTYAPAVVAVQQWYVGPGQQGDAQQAGYDQAAEDSLFRLIRWPTDGYRLFEISHFIGDRDWFDGIIESNCLFVPRWVFEQVGGFDDSFDMAGGGYANLELFERMHSHPEITPTTILGEGTFHQFHGGTTTNVSDEAVRRARVFSYGQHFRDLRGRGLHGVNKPVHYVGSMNSNGARRTRSRREFLLTFKPDRDPVTTTSTAEMPVPEELKLAAIEALWSQQAWRETTWLGHKVGRFPTDLHSYQDLLVAVQPEVVIWIGDDDGLGGRARFSASLLDELGGDRRVLAVGAGASAEGRPEHVRITYVEAPADDPAAVAQITEAAQGRSTVVFLAAGAIERVLRLFDLYERLVPVDSYVVVENTVVNGRPASPGFGPGPHEAVNAIMRTHPDFVPDVAYERYTITFDKNGFLRRMPSAVSST